MKSRTKQINIFNNAPRLIKCIANTHDYLGDGRPIKEADLEVGRIYHLVKADKKPYGEMVQVEEVVSDKGFQAYLFEEMEEYDEDVYRKAQIDWLKDNLDEANGAGL